ncbi:hypothetical protein BDZ91DRAFT_783829 [Kalaharituber pfeilii]|nr:hypothetical protein BDZ91DRAFT_783829 [Kalaharituber pfeilii]
MTGIAEASDDGLLNDIQVLEDLLEAVQAVCFSRTAITASPASLNAGNEYWLVVMVLVVVAGLPPLVWPLMGTLKLDWCVGEETARKGADWGEAVTTRLDTLAWKRLCKIALWKHKAQNKKAQYANGSLKIRGRDDVLCLH